LPPDLPEVSGEINMDLTGSFDQTNSPPLDLDLLLSGKAITVQPLPPNIPRLNTDFLITLTADGNLDELLAADLDIEVKDLTGSGAPLPDSGVGPINLAFQENFFFERAQDQLRIEDGRIQIGKKSFLDWRAELSDLQSAQAVQLTLDELHLDLDEIAALAEPWIPRFITFDRDLGTGIIGITGLHFKGNATGGPAEFDLENLRIVLSGLHIQLEQLDIKNKNIELQLENLNASLENNFPTAISLSLGASIDGFSMTGGQEIFFDNLELRDARLTANQLVLDTLSPYGIKGLLIGEQQLRLNGFELPGQLSIPEFTENISLEARLGESGDASLTVHELTTRVPSVTLMGLPTPNGDKNGSLTTSLAADLQLERINVQQGELPKTEAKGLAAELRLGEMLKFNLHGSMAELGTKELLADFGAQIDLREVSTMAGALLPPGFTAGGNVSIHGVSTGHIPLPAELQVLQNRELPPGIRFCDLSFAENYLFSVEFKDIDLDLPISDDRQIQVRNCHTATPLTLQLKGADKRLTLGGRMELPEIRQLPPAEDIPENMALSLKFSGTTAEFNYFEMGEELEIQPIGLKQAFTLRLAKMDSLLDGKLPISPALILQQIDLDLNNHLSFNRRSDARPLSSAISLGGGLDIDMNLKLRGGESTAFDLSLGADGLYFAMRDKLELNGLDADFQLGKSYRLDLTPKEEQPRPQPPLSLGVLVATGNMGLTGATPATFTERFRQDAKQTQPSFAFKSFRLMGDAPRIELTDSTLNFKLVDSLPVIDNVELNILGGTVLCSLTTSEKDSSYALSLKVAFSGIDAERMLPDLLAELPSSETEISGLVEVETPLSSEPDQLLESLRVRLHISHIGQKMLSRLLYGLDPHESNEAIIKQRKLVELGSPRWIMVTVENGNLSLSGEVSVKGISIALPELKRVNLAGLPIETELRGALAGLADLEKGLNFLRADTLVIEEGKIAPLRR
ncbi:MAG: hypothetical protein OEV64_03965, partial [Desulfobulbaceae bacterium]|nr:hypothetical protein [Desulfobulbaceae bacterium]